MRRTFANLLWLAAALGPLAGCSVEARVQEVRIVRLAYEPRMGLSIDTLVGDVRVRGDSGLEDVVVRAVVCAVGEGEEAARRRLARIAVSVHRSSEGRIVLAADWPGGQRPRERVRFEVAAPRLHDVRLRTTHGAIDLDGLSGPLDLETETGSVKVRRHRGSVRVRSASGGIRLERIVGPVDVEALRSRIEIDHVTGEVLVESERGRVAYRADDGNCHPVTIRTIDGAIDARLVRTMRGTVSCASERGRVSLSSRLRRFADVKERGPSRSVFRLSSHGPRSTLSSETGSIRIGL